MEYESHNTCQSIYYYQGRIEAARGHATSVVGSVDREMYNVTKNSTRVSHKLLCDPLIGAPCNYEVSQLSSLYTNRVC